MIPSSHPDRMFSVKIRQVAHTYDCFKCYRAHYTLIRFVDNGGGLSMNSTSDFIKDVIHERKRLVLKYTTPETAFPGGMLWSDRWEVYSPLISKDITLYGPLELENWILLESDKQVLGFCPQAVWMTGTYQGLSGKSLIDFYTLKSDGEDEYQEVKRQKDMNGMDEIPELKRQITIQRQWCINQRVTHVVKTEKEIEAKPFLLENWGTIIHNCDITRNDDYISKMTSVITTMFQGEETLKDITNGLGGHSEFVLSHLLHYKLIELTNDNERMAWSSKVRLSNKWA